MAYILVRGNDTEQILLPTVLSFKAPVSRGRPQDIFSDAPTCTPWCLGHFSSAEFAVEMSWGELQQGPWEGQCGNSGKNKVGLEKARAVGIMKKDAY